jgi:hypothetical protein
MIAFFTLVLMIGFASMGYAQGTGPTMPGTAGSFQNSSGGSGSIETLPGGFRRFRDSSGNTGILQRTPDSGFPNTQFIAPVPPVLTPSSTSTFDQPSPNPVTPSTRLPQNLQIVPGTQLPQSAGQNR